MCRRSITLRNLWLLALIVLAAGQTGCGNRKPGGSPIAAELRKTLSIANPELRAKEFVKIARQQNDTGDLSGAEDTLSKAAAAAKEVSDPKGRAEAMNSVAFALGEFGSVSKTKELIRDIEATAEQIEDVEKRIAIVARMSYTLGEHLNDEDVAKAHLANAKQLADSIERPGGKIDAFLAIALAYLGIQDQHTIDSLVDESLQVARSIPGARDRTDALLAIGDKLGRLNRTDQVTEVLAEAERATAEIAEELSRAYALADLGRGYAAAGDRQTASKLFDQAEVLADKVDTSMRASLIERINNHRQNR